MILRGINFGCVLDAAGVEGFFGEGYLHHKLFGPFGPNFKNVTFVSKTTTFLPRDGNMPLKENGITPKEFLPKCIVVKFRAGVMLNAEGLSGPGALALFQSGNWQKRTAPFFISFMSVEDTPEKRTEELRNFVRMLAKYLPEFKAKVGLQMNFTCPNVGLNLDHLVDEVKFALKIASTLGIPLMPKFNVLTSVQTARVISGDPNCDAICMSNTIPYGKLPAAINWEKLFGPGLSPLASFGGGGLSGKPLLPLVIDWIWKARGTGIKKPINAGGGILCAEDIYELHDAGADSVFVGSVATLRPWRVRGIVKRAKQLFEKG